VLRSLSNSASGLASFGQKVDVVAHNLANINTVGYKKQRVTFAEMFYQSLARPGLPVNQDSPHGKEVVQGGGVKVGDISREFGQGSLVGTGRSLDFAVQGPGFFEVELPDGSLAYTRNGSFSLDGDQYLVTAQGYRLTAPITIPPGFSEIVVGPSGSVTGKNEEGMVEELGFIPLYLFDNPAGLEAKGENLFLSTEASGFPLEGQAGREGYGQIKQGFIELSNVYLAEEMTELIGAQRAYQFNSRALQTADEMWSLANNLRR
jgi:flagellar basal-body rod protein FlgG